MGANPETAGYPDSDAAGSSLTERYRRIRARTRALCAPLSAEDCSAQSMTEASPVKWHLAHTTWFFETFVLEAHEPGFRPFDEAYRVLFNSYYNGIGEQHPRARRGLLTRPSLAEVLAYREQVDERVTTFLAGGAPPEVRALVELGLHHEQQHQELILMDVKHLLSTNPLEPAYAPIRAASSGPGTAPAMAWHPFPEGVREIGHSGGGFAFDNEAPRHRVFLEPFRLASRPVTCGEFQAFIADGGYRRPELWLDEGWATVRERGWEAPQYWRRNSSGGWELFTLTGRRPLDPAEPVCHLSYFEAEAYARWADARLPSESEWEVAQTEAGGTDGPFQEDGRLHPQAPARSGEGLSQMLGGLWEWTASAYLPYPGFEPAGGAVGEYNGKFMVNQMVLRGGSCATPADHIRPTYRNFFPPDARWPFTGLRLARTL
ncbi:MAG TPA: ergothioneine biosynthesis protein EgtB [Gammaproteobacteria bacterium]|nr:ergothioneine biosynthesis protein EgtB [Gammaproteobacteria bacterium]